MASSASASASASPQSSDAVVAASDASTSTKPLIRADLATTAVQLCATLLLGGGFYYGVARQKRVVEEEKLLPSKAKSGEKVMKVRSATFLEHRLGLDRPQRPSTAAWRALAGGTAVSVTGCGIMVLGLATALGVKSVDEFRGRMEDMLPRMRKSVTRVFGIQPTKLATPEYNEEAELNELSLIFQESMVEPTTNKAASGEKDRTGM